jgi:hypothetical protein
MDVTGAAQYPAHEYRVVRNHPVGHRRARRIAIANGVQIDEAVTIHRATETVSLAQSNAHACDWSRTYDSNDVVRLEELFPKARVSITIHRHVFLSDESIGAHLAQERHEVRGLQQAFAEAGGWMRARDFNELIRAGKKGNLHDQAWDVANRLVATMRGRSKATD